MKILKAQGKENDPIEIICLVGKDLRDWSETPDGKAISVDTLKPSRARVMMYQELIQNAQRAYKDFLDRKQEAGRVSTLLENQLKKNLKYFFCYSYNSLRFIYITII